MRGDRVVLVSLLFALAAGCSGAPVTVKRIDDPESTPTRGVRYMLKKPVYSGFLRLKREFEVDKKSHYEFDILIDQKMVPGTVYEIQVDQKLFSDTEVYITQEPDGSLSSITAGETDKLGDFLTDLASLAVTALAPEKGFKPEEVEDPRVNELLDYISAQLALIKAREEIERELDEALRQTGGDLRVNRDRLDLIRNYRDRLDILRRRIEGNRFPLGKGEFRLTLGEVVVVSAENPWVDVVLTRPEETR